MRKPLAAWQRFALGFENNRPGWATGQWFTLNAVVEIRGPLDVRRLDQAFRQLVDRNDVLRTRIEDGEQVIRPEVPTELELVDESDSDELLFAPVEFTAMSPIRLRLAAPEPGRHLLCLHLHHMLADPATLWIVLNELAALYRGPLPAPLAQFWQYAEDQGRLIADGRTAAEAWWRKVSGPSASPAVTPEGQYALRQRILTADELSELERFSRRNRSTVLISLLAAVACAALPYLGPGDTVLFNTLFSRRNRIEWRALPGPCTVPAYLPLPRPPASLTGDYVAAVRDVVLAAQHHVMDPPTDDASSPFVEYIIDSRPQALAFGEAVGAVIDAAGSRDIGRAARFDIRFRRTGEGELFAHLSGDGIGWPQERALAICASLPWRKS
nr:condensation domain-containing protein [Kibdelosporangium sp. MJ126-NF4]CEL19017.1 Peptide synthetase [Kibdelosporangium sp. MJ126-NF4]CTQ95181.1 Peptide synthetase [Kibdelosporangium sp. MJ126-NF4]